MLVKRAPLLLLVGLLVTLPFLGLGVGQLRRAEIYGETPDLGVRHHEARPECQVVIAVEPKARFNWMGQTWQDPYLEWDSIRIEKKGGDVWGSINHGRTGPVEVGHEVCGLSPNELWRWVYLPDGKVLAFDPT